jgi:hypothetical protein
MTKTTRLTEKIAKLKEEMGRLHGLKARMLAAPDQQISLTDPDSRSMATSGRGSGVVGYNVQVAVDTEHHLIITHEVTNVGTDRAQLAHMAKETKVALEATSLDVVADRGYFSSEEILSCETAGISNRRLPYLAGISSGELYFGKVGVCPCVCRDFISMYGRCLSGEHSNNISAIFGESL